MNPNETPEPAVVLQDDVLSQEDLKPVNSSNGDEALQVKWVEEDEVGNEQDEVENDHEREISDEPPAKKSRSSEELDIRFLISSKVS